MKTHTKHLELMQYAIAVSIESNIEKIKGSIDMTDTIKLSGDIQRFLALSKFLDKIFIQK